MATFFTDTGSFLRVEVTGSTIMSASSGNTLQIIGSGKNIFSVSGSRGPLLEISDINDASPDFYVISSASLDLFKIYKDKTVSISGSVQVTGSLQLNGVDVGGGGGLTVVTTTSATYNETATSGNKLVLLNTTSNNITVNLPTAVGNTATIRFKKIGIPNVVTIDGNGTETIDGHQTALLLRVYESITIMSDNSNWYIT